MEWLSRDKFSFMDFGFDVIGFVLVSGLFAASLTGQMVSHGRGGAKKVTLVRSRNLRGLFFLVATIGLLALVWDLKRKLGFQH